MQNTAQPDTHTTPSERVERDTKIPGLELRHRATGSAWYLAYRTKEGRRRHPKLGDARVMNLTQARDRARSILGLAADGDDPGERGQRRTVQDLRDTFMEKHATKRKPRTAAEYDRMWAVYVLPKLGHLPLASILPDDIEDLHHDLRATPYQANRVAALLRKAFKLAVKWKWLKESPVAVEHYTEHQRRRVPTNAEGSAILRQLDQSREGDPFFAGLVLMLIFTGARIGEVRSARWAR